MYMQLHRITNSLVDIGAYTYTYVVTRENLIQCVHVQMHKNKSIHVLAHLHITNIINRATCTFTSLKSRIIY